MDRTEEVSREFWVGLNWLSMQWGLVDPTVKGILLTLAVVLLIYLALPYARCVWRPIGYYILVLWTVLRITNEERQKKDTTGMKQREKAKLEKRIIGDKLTDALEELWLKDHISTATRDHWYQKLANTFDLPDLLPRGEITMTKRRRIRALKDKVQARLLLWKAATKPEIPGKPENPMAAAMNGGKVKEASPI